MKLIMAKVEISPSKGFIYTLLAIVRYWHNVDNGEEQLLPKSVVAGVKKIYPTTLKFCKDVGLDHTLIKDLVTDITSGEQPSEYTEQDTQDLVKALGSVLPAVRSLSYVQDIELSLYTDARSWLRSGSDNSYARIQKLIGKAGLGKGLVHSFAAGAPDAAPAVQAVRKIVRKLTGRAGDQVPLEDTAALREKKPALWKEYLAAKRAVNEIYKQAIREYVRFSKDGNVDIDEAIAYLEKQGIPHPLPKGYIGRVNEDGALMTEDGVLLKTGTGGAVMRIDPQATIVMNPAYSPNGGKGATWYFKTILPTKSASGRNNEQYFYTGEKLSENRAHKFQVIEGLMANEAKMVKRWRADLQGANFDKKVLAAQCELVYDTCARVGGKDNANKKGQTFGLTTLRVGNVKRKGTSRILEYIGKDAALQKHVLKPTGQAMRTVIALLDDLTEGKVRNDLLWKHDGVVYDANKLRAYFKQVAGVSGATPHKLRHLRGTRLAQQELDKVLEALQKSRAGVSQSAVDKAFQAALTNVGKILGHVKGIGAEQKTVWSTAAKNYVDPSVMVDFYKQFQQTGVRVPTFLARIKD